MRLLVLVVLGGLVPAGESLAVVEGDRTAGRQLAGQCSTCHGLDGFARMPSAPHIGGEPASYLVAQLQAFRDGARQHQIMSIVAGSLTDQQIADLALWYAGHEVAVELSADAAGAPALCVDCHGADGLHRLENVPNLAGEANLYIDTQLKAFRSGRRTHDVMTSIAAELSDADIRAVADWYADVNLTIELVE